MAEFGRIDIILANAGAYFGPLMPEAEKVEIGADHAGMAGFCGRNADRRRQHGRGGPPETYLQGEGGSIVITSSTAGLKSMTGPVNSVEGAIGSIGYPAAKHGVLGLMKAWAGSLAHLSIRVNAIHPTGVNTPFIVNDYFASVLKA